MVATAIIRFGIAPSEAWELRPSEYALLTETYRAAKKEEMDILLKTEEAMDWRFAALCAVLANCHRTKSSDRIWKAVDFMPRRKGEKMTDEEMLAEARRITKVMGGEVKK